MPDVFISYSHQDAEFAFRLKDSLASAGYDVWIDDSGISGGTDWVRMIQEALVASRVLLLVVSPAAMASENVRDEWVYFKNTLKRPIIPLILRQAELPFQLNHIQFIDFRPKQNYDSALARLWAALAKLGVMGTPPPAAPSPGTAPPPEVDSPAGPERRRPLPRFFSWHPRRLLIGGALLVAGLLLALGASAVWNSDDDSANPSANPGAAGSQSQPADSTAGSRPCPDPDMVTFQRRDGAWRCIDPTLRRLAIGQDVTNKDDLFFAIGQACHAIPTLDDLNDALAAGVLATAEYAAADASANRLYETHRSGGDEQYTTLRGQGDDAYFDPNADSPLLYPNVGFRCLAPATDID